jgi:uncharacterized protein
VRRKDKEITDRAEIEAIINKAEICHIALCDGDKPYVIAVNFGFEDKCLYFHCAREGRKLDIIKSNNNVCFMIDTDREMIISDTACDWGFKYKSIIGFGKAFIVDDLDEKKRGLDIIMTQYTDKAFEYKNDRVAGILIVKIEIEYMSGKKVI